MPACILYCTVSISLMDSPYMLCRRSNSVLDRPCSAAEAVFEWRVCSTLRQKALPKLNLKLQK